MNRRTPRNNGVFIMSTKTTPAINRAGFIFNLPLCAGRVNGSVGFVESLVFRLIKLFIRKNLKIVLKDNMFLLIYKEPRLSLCPICLFEFWSYI